MTEAETATYTDFIREAVAEDLENGRFDRVHTRFPPEPNGYLHIGHAKGINIQFGVAEDFGGLTNLRFDDTNPAKEEAKYVEAQKEDMRWLGYDWGDREFFASDYFDQLYEWALQLIREGKAGPVLQGGETLIACTEHASPDDSHQHNTCTADTDYLHFGYGVKFFIKSKHGTSLYGLVNVFSFFCQK